MNVLPWTPPRASSLALALRSPRPRGHAEQVEALGVADHGDDQALAVGQLDREAEVDVVARDDLVAAQLAVDPGHSRRFPTTPRATKAR